MEGYILYAQLAELYGYVRKWFTGDKCNEAIKYFLNNRNKPDRVFKFCDVEIRFSSSFPTEDFTNTQFFSNQFYKDHMVSLVRSLNNYEDAKKFLFTIIVVSIICDSDKDEEEIKKLSRAREGVYRRYVDQLKITFAAKNEYNTSITPEVDVIPSGFRMIYQLLIDDDLRRFDFMYSAESDVAELEKMEIGLRLMEKGNILRKEARGLNRTFETSSKHKVAVYFPKENDNISDGKYSYPRAAIHTARELSKHMRNNNMISALGLNIGWAGLASELCVDEFMKIIQSCDSGLVGVEKLKDDKSIMNLVTIPRVRPHKYLNLTKAEAIIFIIFSMINDVNINLIELKKNPNSPLKGNFTADTISKLNNIGIQISNLETFEKAFIYATKICVKNIRRKGVLSAPAARLLKNLVSFGKKVTLNPEKFTDIDITDYEKHLVLELALQPAEVEAGPSGLM